MDWLIHAAVRAVGGRAVAIPWVMFLVTAILTASGAVVPGAVAIVAPIALGFAVQYGINPVLMGLLIINGATAGGFSPISVFGSIVNGVVERNDLAENAMLLFASSFVFNFMLSVVVFFLFGGRKLLGRRSSRARRRRDERRRFEREVQERKRPAPARSRSPAGGDHGDGRGAGARPRQDPHAVGIVVADRRRAGVRRRRRVRRAVSIAAVLSLISPKARKGAVEQGRVADRAADLRHRHVRRPARGDRDDRLARRAGGDHRPALLAALLICYVGGVVSAFASTTGILGALIPLAVPFLETGAVGAVGLIIALSISSSVVDSSPFSTAAR